MSTSTFQVDNTMAAQDEAVTIGANSENVSVVKNDTAVVSDILDTAERVTLGSQSLYSQAWKGFDRLAAILDESIQTSQTFIRDSAQMTAAQVSNAYATANRLETPETSNKKALIFGGAIVGAVALLLIFRRAKA